VELLRWEIVRADAMRTSVFFFNAANIACTPIEANLVLNGVGQDARLIISPPAGADGGRWKSAICDDAGMQLGIIEIALT
jgi:hypothetical protein